MHHFITQLPKAELHNHLDGSLRLDTILELAKKQTIKLPTFDRQELKNLLVNIKDEVSL